MGVDGNRGQGDFLWSGNHRWRMTGRRDEGKKGGGNDRLPDFFFLSLLLISTVAWCAVFISWAHADIYSTIHTVQTHIYYY